MALVDGVLDNIQDDFQSRSRREQFFDDPVGWIEYMTGEQLWSKQKLVAEGVRDHRSYAVKAAHGVGKTWLAARLICWWVDTRFPDVYVATTAPSTDQLKLVWDNVRRVYATVQKRFEAGVVDHKLPGKIMKEDSWKLDSGITLGQGRKPPDGKEGDSFQGIHNKYVLAVGDEACYISADLIGALGNITTNDNSRRLLIGNPTNPASYFARIFREDMSNWEKETISLMDSPDVTGESINKDMEDTLSGWSYIEDMALEYGEDSAPYISRVLGEFVFDVDGALIEPSDMAVAIRTTIDPEPDSECVIGADIGGLGRDRTVLYINRGGQLRLLDHWQGKDLRDTARRIHQHAVNEGADLVNIDAQGLGVGAYEMLCEEAVQRNENYYLVGKILSSGRSPDRHVWHNLRSYMWDNMRSLLANGKIDIDPDDIDLQNELMMVQYDHSDQSGGLLIQSKREIRKNNAGKSPDFADAAVFAVFTDPEVAIVEDKAKRGYVYEGRDQIDGLPLEFDMMSYDFGLGFQYDFR